MVAISYSDALDLTTAVLYVLLAGIFILWWWVFSRVFVHKKDNDSRSAFMLVMFLAIIIEMCRSIDPFSLRGIMSHNANRCFEQLEITLLLVLLMIAADAASWLNYFAVEGLLLKPVRMYRNVLYIGATQMFCLTVILFIFFGTNNKYFRGIAIGCVMTNLVLIFWALFSMFISVMEVRSAVKAVTQASGQLLSGGDVEHMPTQEELEYADKTRKKSKRVGKYLSVIAIVGIVDLVMGVPIEGDNVDLVYIISGVLLKVIIGLMLWQRRPIRGGRRYDKHITMAYKPFETFLTGDTASKTVGSFKRMVREKTATRQQTTGNYVRPASEPTPPVQGVAMATFPHRDGQQLTSTDEHKMPHLPLEAPRRM